MKKKIIKIKDKLISEIKRIKKDHLIKKYMKNNVYFRKLFSY